MLASPAFLVQLVGYGALLALYPHSDPSPAVELLGRVPWPFLIPLAILAVPAIALAAAVGALLTRGGLPPGRIPTVLFATGDTVVFAAAFLLAVASLRISRRWLR